MVLKIRILFNISQILFIILILCYTTRLAGSTNVKINYSEIKSENENDKNLLNYFNSLSRDIYYLIEERNYISARDSLNKYQILYFRNELSIQDVEVRYYYLIGLLHYSQRQFDSSNYFYKRAYSLGLYSKNDSIIYLSLKSLGNIQYLNRSYDSALFYYYKSIFLENRKKIPSKINLASLYQNVGICLSQKGKNDSALIYFRQSLKLKETYLAGNDPVLAKGYLNFSRFLQIIGEFDEAIINIEKAENIYFSIFGENDPILGPLYFNKGSILITLNDYENALQYHEKALANYKLELQEGHELISQLYLNFGTIYSYLNKFELAIQYYKESLKGDISNEDRVKVFLRLGLTYLELDSLNQADMYLNLSLNTAEKFLGLESSLTAYTYLSYGFLLEKKSNCNNALDLFNKASKIYKNNFGEKSRDLSNSLTYIGNHYANNYMYFKAIKYFQKALISYVDSYNDSCMYSNPEEIQLESDMNLFYTLTDKSSVLYLYYLQETKDIKDLKMSLKTAELAIKLFEKIKFTLGGENTKLLVTSKATEIYDLAVFTAAELYSVTNNPQYLETAFKNSEKSKAAVLLSTIKESEALQILNIPNDVKESEKKLKSEIAQYQNIIFEETQKEYIDSNKVARIRNKLFNSKIQYDSLISSLEEKYPEYYNLKYNFDVIGFDQIQNKLQLNHALIEYKMTDSILFVFIIKSDSILLCKHSVGDEFKAKVNEFLNCINHIPDPGNLKLNSKKFGLLGYELSNILELNNPILSNIERLVIIPDDILGYLSFDALIADKPDLNGLNYRKLNYQINKYVISYGYSGTLLLNDQKKRSTGRNVLAMAPTYKNINEENKNLTDFAVRELADILIPLKYTQSEVGAIIKLIKGDVYIGPSATEQNFKEKSPDYNILHFAMHTIINDDDPLTSKLVFSLDNSDTVEDGFLNTYEIYNLDLNAELAVLSACKTGTGKISKGEGIMSLARGFLYAGVPGIVMTLWAVEDISGSEIIADFYRNMKNGFEKDISLRNAKLKYLRNANQLQSHPYFWAAYVHIGDTRPLNSVNYTYFIFFGGVSFLVAVILSILIFRKKKSKRIHSLNH